MIFCQGDSEPYVLSVILILGVQKTEANFQSVHAGHLFLFNALDALRFARTTGDHWGVLPRAILNLQLFMSLLISVILRFMALHIA
jgi:hypothetical protein